MRGLPQSFLLSLLVWTSAVPQPQARADVLLELGQSVTLSRSGADMTIERLATANTVGFSTYYFSLTPTLQGETIGAIDANFTTEVPAIGQFQPMGTKTVFADQFNDANTPATVDDSQDSHFEFISGDVHTLASEDTDTQLSAFFSLSSTPIGATTDFAQVMLQDGILANAKVSVAERLNDMEQIATFEFKFGASAVPEPGSLGVLTATGVVGLVIRRRRRRAAASR